MKDEVVTEETFDLSEGGRRRAEYTKAEKVGRIPKYRGDFLCVRFDRRFFRPLNEDAREHAVWRVASVLSVLEFLFCKTQEVVGRAALKAVVVWGVGLGKYAACSIASACPSTYLSEQLKSPFCCAKVRDE